ncbi:spermidine synthase 3, partial [Striga asiatica]
NTPLTVSAPAAPATRKYDSTADTQTPSGIPLLKTIPLNSFSASTYLPNPNHAFIASTLKLGWWSPPLPTSLKTFTHFSTLSNSSLCKCAAAMNLKVFNLSSFKFKVSSVFFTTFRPFSHNSRASFINFKASFTEETSLDDSKAFPNANAMARFKSETSQAALDRARLRSKRNFLSSSSEIEAALDAGEGIPATSAVRNSRSAATCRSLPCSSEIFAAEALEMSTHVFQRRREVWWSWGKERIGSVELGAVEDLRRMSPARDERSAVAWSESTVEAETRRWSAGEDISAILIILMFQIENGGEVRGYVRSKKKRERINFIGGKE